MSEQNSKLEKLYEVIGWPEDPRSSVGRERLKTLTTNFKRVFLEVEELMNIIKGRRVVRVIELCSGMGIGGYAISKCLVDLGLNVELTLTDLREKVLVEGAKYISERLKGVNVDYYVVDAKKLHSLKVKPYDISLMVGYSAPHFNPEDMLLLLSSLCSVLDERSAFIAEETDRVYSIFYMRGYREFLLENYDGNDLVVSIHLGYDPIRGVFKRAYFRVSNPRDIVICETHLWSLSELIALMKCFFKRIVVERVDGNRFFIVSLNPRRLLKPEDFTSSRFKLVMHHHQPVL